MRPFLAPALAAGCTNRRTSVQQQESGTPCSSTALCGTGDFFCATDGRPNGYCKQDCATDADCPRSPPAVYRSRCAWAGEVHRGECHRVGTSAAECRTQEGCACELPPNDARYACCDAPDESSADGS